MMKGVKSSHVTTGDGVKLHYVEAGTGQVLLMLHSWCGNVEQFAHQFEGLSDRYRCICVEMRGHGDSEKPETGYKVQRLTADVHDVLQALDLSDVVALGHSMGSSIMWCYWDLFGKERLGKLILVDQSPFITGHPAWSDAEREAAGTLFGPAEMADFCNTIAASEDGAVIRELFGGLFTRNMPEAEKTALVETFLKIPPRHAATLLYNHASQDWRDVIPRIDIPTLVVGGRASIIPWRSQEWIHEKIAGSRLEIFEEEEGGQHFMFVEEPSKFNRIVSEFAG